MSVQRIKREFDREAELLRKAVACGSMTAAEAKKTMHAVLRDLIAEEESRIALHEASVAVLRPFDLEKEFTEFWAFRWAQDEKEGT